MKTPSIPAAMVALTLASGLALGQGQPNASVSRHIGLDVLSVVNRTGGSPLTPGGITLTVHAPAGSLYDLILETSPASADYSLSLPIPVGPLTSPMGSNTVYFAINAPFGNGFISLLAPIPLLPIGQILSLPMYFTDPAGGVPGKISPGATSQTLVSTFQLPAPSLASFQALVVRASGSTPAHPGPTSYLTDGQKRLVVPTSTTLATSGYSRAKGAVTSGNVRDVEQGDLDGDGDLDEVAIGSPSNGWTFSRIQFPSSGPTRINSVGTMGAAVQTTSAEIVDLDDDGHLDFIVGASQVPGVAATPGNLFRAYRVSPTGGQLVGTPIQVTFDTGLASVYPMDITDIETADFNGDGFIDVYASCGGVDCNKPELNRMFFGTLTPNGYQLTEVTRQNFQAFPLDDSWDGEVFDYDGDGDMDIVVGNYAGGPSATFGNSVNLIHINNGAGIFTTIPAPGPARETADILAVDIDRNGFDDLYIGNYLAIDEVCNFGSIVPDNLFLNSGGAFTDATPMILGNNWATLDVEAVSTPQTEFAAQGLSTRDYDGDGDIDIFIGLGSHGNLTNPVVGPAVPGITRGILILKNQQSDMGIAPGGPLPLFDVDMASTKDDVTDIEFGDWINIGGLVGRWFEKDLGVATWQLGITTLTKNQ